MKTDLITRWDKGDKVGSLQIAIQSCKLLHDTSNAVISIQNLEIPYLKICELHVDCLKVWNLCF